MKPGTDLSYFSNIHLEPYVGMIGHFVAINQETLDRLKDDPGLLEEYIFPSDGEEPPNSIDVDKAWHGIHFMLNGAGYDGDGPLTQAIFGGEGIGEEMDYGPARVLTPQQVSTLSAALEELGIDGFSSRYDPQAMDDAEIYPGIWVRDGRDGLDYLLEHYRNVTAFYAAAAARGDGAILWLG